MPPFSCIVKCSVSSHEGNGRGHGCFAQVLLSLVSFDNRKEERKKDKRKKKKKERKKEPNGKN